MTITLIRRKLRLLALLSAFVLLMTVLSGCGSPTANSDADPEGGDAGVNAEAVQDDGAIAQIKDNGKLRVAVFADKPPFGYLDESGANVGFDIVIAKRVVKDLLGDESAVEWVLVEPANRVDYLESDKVDLVFANFTVTPERAERVDFALPYMKVALGVVSPESSPINDVSDLEGKQLIVIKGTTAETYFTDTYPDIELLKYDEISEAFQALTDGRGAGLAQDNTFLFAWANQNPGYTVGVGSLGNQDTIAPAVRKGNTELLEWLNEELRILGQERFIHKAYDEALAPVYGDVVDPEDLVVEGGEL
ncbi:MAG: transporter substrate-binding domain-containing protein [Clostridiales Family XIII bacterium]|jgi:polar amino acid transport system substrate-binding protein|nr:transporter substrate-binding domain-containing protein [Clostridiales Family XIII bacterium]